MQYTINGLFLTQRTTGIQRYAREICRELDRLVPAGQFELAVPPAARAQLPALQHIAVKTVGKHRGFWWEQWDLACYLRRSGTTGIHFCNVVPLLCPHGVVTVHDVSYRANPRFFRSVRGRLSAAWHCLQYRVITKKAKLIFTDSEFSHGEIRRYYPGTRPPVKIVPCGWQHMERVAAQEEYLGRYPQIARGKYCFSMATAALNKNLQWVLRAARANPETLFVIAGKGCVPAEPSAKPAVPDNVLFTGYLSDAAAKALMAHCRFFLFPTLYEGFGLPPLEALACGAPGVIVSDTPCMREVYGAAAYYCDPADPAPVLPAQDAAGEKADAIHLLLQKMSWKNSAQAVLHALQKNAAPARRTEGNPHI